MEIMVEEEENTQERKEGNPENLRNQGNQGDDVKYIYNFIFTFFRSKYIWKSTAYFFIFS